MIRRTREILTPIDSSCPRYLCVNPIPIVIASRSLFQGHAAPILYAVWMENGFLEAGAVDKLRQLGNTLEGHPTPVRSIIKSVSKDHTCIQRLDFIDVATGSLGQGLSTACGMAYTGKNFDRAR